jgi:hypothetical protein
VNNFLGLVKKLYVDLGISQTAVWQPWCVNFLFPHHSSASNVTHHSRFASLVVQSLPVEYLNRVWDIFLYEGSRLVLLLSLHNSLNSYAFARCHIFIPRWANSYSMLLQLSAPKQQQSLCT